jgi:hypothetical protein
METCLVLMLMFAQQAQAPIFSNATTVSTLQVWSGGTSEPIAICDEVDKDGLPSKCHLANGHTLDEVMQVMWQESERHSEAYKSLADKYIARLKKDIEISQKLSKLQSDIEKQMKPRPKTK